LDVGDERVRFDNPLLPDTRSEMSLPLTVGELVLGALDVQSTEPAAFTEEDIAVLQLVADQVAVAIRNAQLFADAEAAVDAERRAYGQISRQGWEQVLRTVPSLGYSIDERGLSTTDDRVWSQPRIKAAWQTGQMVPEQSNAGGVALPIKVRGQVIGVLDANKPAGKGEWTTEEIELLETLTGQLEVALESARLYQDTQRRAAEDRLIGDITTRMRETLDVDTVLQTAIQEMGTALGLPKVEVRMRSVAAQPDNGRERPDLGNGQKPSESQAGQSLPEGTQDANPD
jgi:GAF domain-containing protein